MDSQDSMLLMGDHLSQLSQTESLEEAPTTQLNEVLDPTKIMIHTADGVTLMDKDKWPKLVFDPSTVEVQATQEDLPVGEVVNTQDSVALSESEGRDDEED